MDSRDEDSFHQFNEDPSESSPLNVEVPSPYTDSANVEAISSLAGSEVPKDLIPLES